jgi:hypothetical protein
MIDMLPLDTASRGRRMLKLKRDVEAAKAKQFELDVAMAKQGKVLRFGRYVDVDDMLPHGIPNRHRRRL